jgi:hypothetical protein
VQNSGVGGGIEAIAARIAEEVQSNLRALADHPVFYTTGTSKRSLAFTVRCPRWEGADEYCGRTYYIGYFYGRDYWWWYYTPYVNIPMLSQIVYRSILSKARSDFNYYKQLISNPNPSEIVAYEEQPIDCNVNVHHYVIRLAALKDAVVRNRNFPAYSLTVDRGMFDLLNYALANYSSIQYRCPVDKSDNTYTYN